MYTQARTQHKHAASTTRTWGSHAEAAWTVERAAVGAAGSSRAVHPWAWVRHRAGAVVGEDGERGVQGACGVQHTTGFQTCIYRLICISRSYPIKQCTIYCLRWQASRR